MQPVGAPPLARDDDPKARLAETRDALREANRRINGGRAWYEAVRESYQGAQ
ncbi:hypothetical protein [Bradyrhizobium lablabi]|uniref:hypothetical protein n=1 Tax=Bradyrhizobium lablabi TaxID=722472 RepID=UPI001BA6D1C8|nr:hypothetical protein [Bradyrhizobium lablabi]MBR0695936.1 hypothetical protein [Bradyrhizobium lablabi]